MFVDPKLPIDTGAAKDFLIQNAVLDYYRDGNTSKERIKELFPKGQEVYLKRLLDGTRIKGARPWEVVNITKGLDVEQPWIGIEWETGFCTQAEYKGVVQWMWENHHNWALDNEGIGPWLGEFTFPPIEVEKFAAAESMMDSMRTFMASKGIITPSKWDMITRPDGSKYPATHSQDPRSRWGCHVNISIPETRSDSNKTAALSRLMDVLFTGVLLDSKYNRDLFGRQPYGWGGNRNGNDNTSWMEWKLFKTPASDEEVERNRKVIIQLAELMQMVASNPRQFFPKNPTQNGYGNGYVHEVWKPQPKVLRDWLLGEREDLELTESTHTSYYDMTSFVRTLSPN